MTVIAAKCVVRHTKKLFNVQEQKSKVIFHNPNQHEVQEITVDGCVVTEGERCDYLLLVDDADVSVFVELKGSDVKHALEQLEETHKQLRCPLTSTEVQVRTLHILNKFEARLKIKNSPVEHTF